jgi:hypothetical protein
MFLYRLLTYIAIPAVFPILVVLYYLYQIIKSLLKKRKRSLSAWIDQIGDEIHGLAGNYTTILLIVSVIAFLLTNTAVHQWVGINNRNYEKDCGIITR